MLKGQCGSQIRTSSRNKIHTCVECIAAFKKLYAHVQECDLKELHDAHVLMEGVTVIYLYLLPEVLEVSPKS
jgi:hypothetical protein